MKPRAQKDTTGTIRSRIPSGMKDTQVKRETEYAPFLNKIAMKEAVNFLREVYGGSVVDVANILTAEAENDKGTIKKYLHSVKDYVDGLMEQIDKP